MLTLTRRVDEGVVIRTPGKGGRTICVEVAGIRSGGRVMLRFRAADDVRILRDELVAAEIVVGKAPKGG